MALDQRCQSTNPAVVSFVQQSLVAVDVGDAHLMPYYNFPFLQVPNWWWNGGAIWNAYTAQAWLQPNGVLSLTSGPPGATSFSLNDVPTAGSVVLQSSTNLTLWSAMVTNPANGGVLSYSFPNTNARAASIAPQWSPERACPRAQVAGASPKSSEAQPGRVPAGPFPPPYFVSFVYFVV